MSAPASLFSPLALGNLELPNRVAVAPMCQYSANDGCATAWHLQHLMNLAMSGAGLVMIEATGVERAGRITHGCLGLYSDENERALAKVLREASAVALPGTQFGIQLSHAGRKGSAHRPWEGGGSLQDGEGWRTFAPSEIPHRSGWHVPASVGDADVERILAAFRAAARRAERIGIRVIEVHMAHGYLLHQFLSPLSNHRSDAWGGDAERRMALPLAVARAVREVAPDCVVGARITGSDWAEGGLEPHDAVMLARALKAIGLDYVCVTSSGIPTANPTVDDPDSAQIPLAAIVRKETGIVTRAVGLIVDPVEANEIIETGQADQVAIARAFLDDPRWGWHAAHRLGKTVPYPGPYAWAAPAEWSGIDKAQRA
ncbi:oxidoreductase [Microvirga sp. 2TAF3]|uniref:oxidoreductase n=1 Tax=Microvirga sp. 2TAF3 TaxID=3233014 RepID=UPI003F9468BD